MAKKQTFTSKLGKDAKNFKFVKHIKTVTSEESGHVKFVANMVRLDENENIDQAMKRMEEEASVTLAFGESVVDAEEVVTEDTPAEEIVAEEIQDETPAEETPAEETQEEAPAEEEVPVEESSEESVPEEDSAEKADESSKE